MLECISYFIHKKTVNVGNTSQRICQAGGWRDENQIDLYQETMYINNS